MKGISMLSANKQFTIYFIYACGLSTFLVIFAYTMDSISVPSDIQPGIGVGNCYLKRKCENKSASISSIRVVK